MAIGRGFVDKVNKVYFNSATIRTYYTYLYIKYKNTTKMHVTNENSKLLNY